MTLEEFRKNKGLTYAGLADFLGFKQSTVYNMCKNIGCITLKNAYQVTSKTKGQVTYVDLLEGMEDC